MFSLSLSSSQALKDEYIYREAGRVEAGKCYMRYHTLHQGIGCILRHSTTSTWMHRAHHCTDRHLGPKESRRLSPRADADSSLHLVQMQLGIQTATASSAGMQVCKLEGIWFWVWVRQRLTVNAERLEDRSPSLHPLTTKII